MANKHQQNQGSQTVVRAVDILKLIAGNNAGARLIDIANEMQLEKPTAHRLLKTLTTQGLLVKDEQTRKYRLGSLIFELGLVAKRDFDISALCAPVLKKMANETLDTAFLFIRSGNEAVCVARETGGYYIQTPVIQVGSRQPLGVSAGGLALLSALPVHEVDELLKQCLRRLTTYDDLTIKQIKALYFKSKKQGYAEIENHAVSGVKGIGMPIVLDDGRPIAAIAVATTIERMDSQHIALIIPTLHKAAAEIKLLLANTNYY